MNSLFDLAEKIYNIIDQKWKILKAHLEVQKMLHRFFYEVTNLK